jgi:phage baseplate assembly protein W
MPYKNIEINIASPISEQAIQTEHFYKGFSSVDRTKRNSSLYDFSLVTQDLINNFNTKKNERLMNPSFGSSIWDLLMEPLTEDTRQLLSDDILAICAADPRITPIQVDLSEYDQGYILELTLQFTGTDQSANLRLSFDQSIGLSVIDNTIPPNNYNIPG